MRLQKGLALSQSKGFSTVVIILLVALVVIVGGGITAFLYLTSTVNPSTQSNAYTPATLDVKVPSPDSETGFNVPTATPSAAPIATPAPAPRTQTTTIGQVDVSTILSTDRKTLGVFFKSSSNFTSVSRITYSLTYDTDNASQRNIQGVVTVASETINTDSEGKKVIQKNLTIGTCSSGACIYDTNPRNFRVSISTN